MKLNIYLGENLFGKKNLSNFIKFFLNKSQCDKFHFKVLCSNQTQKNFGEKMQISVKIHPKK